MNTYFDANASNFQWTATPGLTAHLMALTYYVHRISMDKLMAEKGYEKLSITHDSYISLLAERDYSPGELATKLDISKQACSKTIKEIEQSGWIERRPNPADSRSSLLSLTEKGLILITDGLEVTNELHQQFVNIAGSEEIQNLITILERLCNRLDINIPTYQRLEETFVKSVSGSPSRLNLYLPKLSNYCYETLITSLTDKGFEGLKPNFSQVLGLIGPEGGRIQHISALVGVSKQAIAVISAELEHLGYITREPDPDDKRQIILRTSQLGQRLLNEAADSIRQLESTMQLALGQSDFRKMEATLATLYSQAIASQGTVTLSATKIQKLSQSLLDELGVRGTQILAQHLLSITKGNS